MIWWWMNWYSEKCLLAQINVELLVQKIFQSSFWVVFPRVEKPLGMNVWTKLSILAAQGRLSCLDEYPIH